MKKDHLTFSAFISGAISSLMMIATVPFADRIGHSYVVGYATSSSLYCLSSWRSAPIATNAAKGQITFGKPSSSASPSR